MRYRQGFSRRGAIVIVERHMKTTETPESGGAPRNPAAE
jgi:hypothetical protein